VIGVISLSKINQAILKMKTQMTGNASKFNHQLTSLATCRLTQIWM